MSAPLPRAVASDAMDVRPEHLATLELVLLEGIALIDELGLSEQLQYNLLDAFALAITFAVLPFEEARLKFRERVRLYQTRFNQALRAELVKAESRSTAAMLWHDFGVAELCHSGVASDDDVDRWLDLVSKRVLS